MSNMVLTETTRIADEFWRLNHFLNDAHCRLVRRIVDCGRHPQDLLNLLGVNKYAHYRATTFKKHHSPSGNWTPVSRVTGGDTYHYINEDCRRNVTPKSFSERRTLPSRTSNTSNTDCGRRPQDLLNLLGVNKYALYRATTFKTHHSPSGNWTPVSRVTGGDTYHYTNEDCRRILTPKSFSERRTLPSRTSNTSNTDCGRRPQDLLNLLGVNKYALYRATTFKTHHSPSGNWTPVSRVTGGDTYHYTNEDCRRNVTPKSFSERRTLPSRRSNTSNTDCGRRPQDLLNLLGVNKYALYRATTFKTHHSPSGNWTPVSRVTGGDTYHYTNEDCRRILTPKSFSERRTLPSRSSNRWLRTTSSRPPKFIRGQQVRSLSRHDLQKAPLPVGELNHSPSGNWTDEMWRSPAWQAGILTTILTRIADEFWRLNHFLNDAHCRLVRRILLTPIAADVPLY